MSNRKGQRIDIWMPDELSEWIDAQREWRTRSEFIRNLIAANMGCDSAPTMQPAPKPKAEKPPHCAPPTEREFSAIAPLLADSEYWETYAKPYGGYTADFFAMLSAVPMFADALSKYRSNK